MIALLALAAAAAPQPQVVVTIDPQHRLVEGVASDGRTIWASSVLDRTIVACRRTCKDWARLPQGLHPLGLAWDKQRKLLWVAADCPELPGVIRCDRGALLALDGKGRVVRRLAPWIGEFHVGDVSADRGEVFVSDSKNGMVFHLLPNQRSLMSVVLPDTGKSAQGTALDPAGTRLVVADYSQGIGITGISQFKRTLLPRQDSKPLRGIDGLVRCGLTYYGIYNGTAPGALVRFTIDTDGKGIAYDQPWPDLQLADPTQIAFDGKRLLIVANAGWEAAGRTGVPRRDGAPIIAVPIGKDCRPI